MTEQAEQTTYPVEYSLRGDNTHYVPCDHRGCQQNYAVCLNVNKAYDEGRRTPEDYCSKEIKNGKCYAAAMRQEELAAGHTLYYKPRKKVEVKAPEPKAYIVPASIKQSEGYQRGFNHAGEILGKKVATTPATPRISKSAPTASNKPKVESMDLASVVSQMAKEHAAGAVEVERPSPAPVALPVTSAPESMLEKARRIREQRGNV